MGADGGYPLFVWAVLAFVFASVKPTDLVFVRHGETVANATGKYNSKTLNVFSEKGQAGVDDLTRRLLSEPKFEKILVSPSPRALKTIAPYLRASHQKATVWPLLYECCTGHRPKNAAATRFSYGAKVVLPKDIADLFIVDPSRNRLPVASDYNAGLAQVEASIEEFRRSYAGTRILLVGHSGHGGQFLHAFTGRWQKVDNTKEIRVSIP